MTSLKSSSLLKMFLVTSALAAAVLVWHGLDLGSILSLETVRTHREDLLAYTESHYAQAVFLFILVYCLTAALSLPGDLLLTVAGGFLFGSLLGTLYVNVGATIGATLAFLSARFVLRRWVESRYGARLGSILHRFEQDGFSYLIFLRLVPAFPFVLVNLLSGLTRIKLRTYILATSLGMLPASFVFAYAGRQLGSITSLEGLASAPVLAAFLFLGLLALVPVMVRRRAPASLTGPAPPPARSAAGGPGSRRRWRSIRHPMHREVTHLG